MNCGPTQKFSYIVRVLLPISVIGVIIGVTSMTLVESFADRKITYMLVALLGLSVFGRIWYGMYRYRLDWVEPGIWFAIFYFAHFGIRAIHILMFGSPIIGLASETGNLGMINTALGASVIGLLAFWLGYYIHFGRNIGSSLPALPRNWNITGALALALLCILIGWALRLFGALQLGGIAAWLAADKHLVFAENEGTMYLVIVGNLARVGLYILLILARAHKGRSYWFLFICFLVPDLIYNFLSGSRGQFVFLLMGLIVILWMTSDREHRTGMRYGRWAAILLIALIVLFPLFSALRGGIISPEAALLRAATFWADPLRLFEVMWVRQHGLDSLAVVIQDVPEIEPFAFGQQLFLPLVAWIPRAIWPEKPVISLGEIFYQKFFPPIFHEGTAVAVTLPGQFYWALGFAGIVPGLFFMGVLWQVVFRYLVQPRGNLSNVLLVSTMFPVFFLIVEQTTVDLFTMHLFHFLMVMTITLVIGGSSCHPSRNSPRASGACVT
jgi:oligosaccharide repeat unit polymerase